MAKKSMVNRELKRSRLVAQYADKRASLKKIMGKLAILLGVLSLLQHFQEQQPMILQSPMNYTRGGLVRPKLSPIRKNK